MFDLPFLTALPNLDPLLIAVIAMQISVIVFMAFAFRRNVRNSANGVGPYPIILTILLAEVLFGHVMISMLLFHPAEQIRMSEIDIMVSVGGAIALAAMMIRIASDTSRFKLNRFAGYILNTWLVGLGILIPMLAYADAPRSVDFVTLIVSCLSVILINGYIHDKVLLGKLQMQASVSFVVTTTLQFAAQFAIAKSIIFMPSELSLLTHDGKSALWLEVFMTMISILALGLCAVMGNNPRQHWRRYAVTAVLVSIMSVSIFVANELSLRYSNTHFELARLIEALNGQRSTLYGKYLRYSEDEDQSMTRTVPSDVFRNLQIYFDTSVQVDRLMQNETVEDDIQAFYAAPIESERETMADFTLADETDQFYQFLKSEFGLQAVIVEFSDLRHVMFERRLNDLANMIIAHAREASEIQLMIKDMALLGGLFIVAFLTFGVFLPAHRSTIQALDALEAEKARIYKLALCAEHTTKGIVLTNGRGQVTWCNDAFCDMTGFRFSELEGKTLLQMTRNPDADQSEIDRIMIDLRNRKPSDIEVLAKRKDGQDFWLSGSITPVVENDRLNKVVHVFNDVTEEREMRDRLAAARSEAERLAVVVRHASDGIAILGKDLAMTWANPSLTRMTGYDFDELKDVSLHELLRGPETNAEDIADMLSAIALREPFSAEFLCYRKDQSPYWIEAQHSPLFDEEGECTGYVVAHRDITERKELELEIISSRDDLAVRVEERTQTIMNQALELEKALAAERELNRMQTEFVSMASHEFRTPLTIIDGVARRLEKRADRWTPDDIREKAQTLRSTVKRMTMLVERTLDASRLSSGRIKLTPEHFDVQELVEEVCARQRELATTHTIDVDIRNFPQTLFGDARLMDNIFTNIVSNAVKYSGESKYVRVTGATEDDFAVLHVRDHGIGIPKEEISKIFQRFFRASTSTGIPGTGIGLNLVKSLVEMHYGSVEIESEVGEWTEFTIRLPIESPLETGVISSDARESDATEAENQSAA